MVTIKALLRVLLATAFIRAFANDPDALQDVCVADYTSGVHVNGFPCKDANKITAEDFFYAGISEPAKNLSKATPNPANVQFIPGLNTLGISMNRADFPPKSQSPPHTHPRATEIVFVLKGEFYVGLVTTEGKFISKVIKEGEVFVFPKGLIHFQKNLSGKLSSQISAFNSQLPATYLFVPSIFTAQPPVPSDILTHAFFIDTDQVENIRNALAKIYPLEN